MAWASATLKAGPNSCAVNIDLLFLVQLGELGIFERDLQGISADIVDEFLQRDDQALAGQRTGHEVGGDLADAFDQVVDMAAGPGELLLVGGVRRLHAVDLEFDNSQQGSQLVVQVGGDAGAFLLHGVDLRQDVPAVQLEVAALLAGNGKNEIGDNDAQQDAADQYGCKDVCLVGMHAIAFVYNRLQIMRMKYIKK